MYDDTRKVKCNNQIISLCLKNLKRNHLSLCIGGWKSNVMLLSLSPAIEILAK